MKCNNCGTVIDDNAVYCPQCGIPVNKEVSNATNVQYNKQDAEYQNTYQAGKLMGYASIICAVLGLGSFGTLDVIALLLSHFGKKKLKTLPNNYPGKDYALGLNTAGFVVSGGLLVVAVVVLIGMILFGAAGLGIFAGI